MQLSLPADSQPIQEMFEPFFASESTSVRIRAAEPVGVDAQLWISLAEADAAHEWIAEVRDGETQLTTALFARKGLMPKYILKAISA